jgi:hypothetical protein
MSPSALRLLFPEKLEGPDFRSPLPYLCKLIIPADVEERDCMLPVAAVILIPRPLVLEKEVISPGLLNIFRVTNPATVEVRDVS